jgi:hypothetical protein
VFLEPTTINVVSLVSVDEFVTLTIVYWELDAREQLLNVKLFCPVTDVVALQIILPPLTIA